MRILDANIITMSGEVSDVDLKERLVREALEQAGMLDEDNLPFEGVTTDIRRVGGKSGQGDWRVSVTRDLRQSDQPRLTAPGT